MEHILNLEQVKKYYGGNSGNITKAVDGISMYVDKGEFVATKALSSITFPPSQADWSDILLMIFSATPAGNYDSGQL